MANTELSELRVVARTKEGGHYVDNLTIVSNFYGNLEKLNLHYAIFDLLQIIDTSETEHRVIAVSANEEIITAIDNSACHPGLKTTRLK